jgi:signal transduction histidine kinase
MSDNKERPERTEKARSMTEGWLWRHARALAAPLVIWAVLVGALALPVLGWLDGEDEYDRAVMKEWIDEARNSEATLADRAGQYVAAVNAYADLHSRADGKGPDFFAEFYAHGKVNVTRANVRMHLQSLGEPATKMYQGMLPLFPVIYRLEVTFDPELLPSPERLQGLEPSEKGDPVVWDSGLEPTEKQIQVDEFPLMGPASGEERPRYGWVKVHYQLHAWDQRRRREQSKAERWQRVRLLALAAAGLGVAWLLIAQVNERERQRQRERAREELAQAERQRLEEERKRVETERQLLEQKLATQAAERQALELKSHLYASIGIMAGSYAHNIKNLLVRPNDLLRRLLETEEVRPDQERMLREVQQTLGTVTERLQQILHTVRRDPSQATMQTLDLNAAVRSLARTWADLAADRWQLDLTLDLAEGELPIPADASHLQQAAENLLFNARDATFEMRNHLREMARRADGDAATRRQRVIEAAGWRGKVVIRTRRRDSGEVVLEVSDNGAGMTEEVRRRCTETHFSTKRDNALYQGHSTGMGLGLSFVLAILEHHRAKLEIESQVHQGTTFRAVFPA